jgi:hypothetical protein
MILIRIMVQQPKLAFIIESTLILIQSMMCQNIYSKFVMHETKVHYIINGDINKVDFNDIVFPKCWSSWFVICDS